MKTNAPNAVKKIAVYILTRIIDNGNVKNVFIKKMPTLRQEKAFKEVMKTYGSVGQAMTKAKYAKSTTNVPKVLTESKGWKELCEQHGLTDKLLLSSLTEDIKKKPQDRNAELTLGFRIKGRLIEKPQEDGQSIHLHFNEKILNITTKAEKELQEELEKEI